MIYIRSLLFNLTFYLWTILVVIVYVPALLGPSRWIVYGQRQWVNGIIYLQKLLTGTLIEVRGRERIPPGPVIVASKHQSAWDTFIYHKLLDDPAIVLKQELLRIPIYGAYCRKVEMIAVDRKGGSKALRAMLKAGRDAAAKNRPLVIFPEGTRSAPGESIPYQPGIAAFYRDLKVPVVPVALNSGLFWPRRQFLRRPGTIVLEFLPAIEPGLDRKKFVAELEQRIEGGTQALITEAS
ncbi:MAG TPA: 1-acyl-sn-glycerol-3-phosphate acyltransferase [Sneathiellales bacterium]|nr:1-acyl-sn-glycerol-3-phosphate acyltransferase [Sneathiellales bacterium]